MTDRRIQTLARWGWEITAVLPSGRVFIRFCNGKIMQCASLNKAYNAIVEWRKKAIGSAPAKRGRGPSAPEGK